MNMLRIKKCLLGLLLIFACCGTQTDLFANRCKDAYMRCAQIYGGTLPGLSYCAVGWAWCEVFIGQ